MGNFSIEESDLDTQNQGGELLKNVKELTVGDGKLRIKDGAIIITDDTGTDRVIIGYFKDGF